MRPVFELARDVPVLVRVFEKDEEEQVKEWGGTRISFSDAAVEDFLKWFEEHKAKENADPPAT